METRYSNMVYVVSLSRKTRQGWKLSPVDLLEAKRRYHYSVRPSWPDPPNYLAFRCGGKLQSIHHVEGCDIVDNPRRANGNIAPARGWGPRYVFRLGPSFRPDHEVRTGKGLPMATRCWCMLDTLMTCRTISEAKQETKRRELVASAAQGKVDG